MIIERTNYYALNGQLETVVALRREASAVRVALGLPVGRICIKQGYEHDGPDVTWECGYTSVAAYQRDLAARAASSEFEQVRERMGQCIDRFERHLNTTDDVDSRASPGYAPLPEYSLVPRRIGFDSAQETLNGFLYLPPGKGPFPCVITNHGSSIDQGTTDLCRPGTASLLLHWGIASFLPHRRGYGESSGDSWTIEVDAEFGSADYDSQIVARLDAESNDVVAAARLLEGLPEIDAQRIAVMGSSFGGTVTLFAASKWDGFRCAVEFAGAAINWQHTPALRDAMRHATRNTRCPIFFLQAENDYCVEPTRVLGNTASDAGHPIQSRVYPAHGLTADEGHYFERSGSLVWGPDVHAFLQRWLLG